MKSIFCASGDLFHFRMVAEAFRLAGRRQLVLREGLAPVDVEFDVPVEALAQLVEAADLGVRGVVVPVVRPGQRRVEDLADDFDIVVGEPLGEIVIVEILDIGRRTFTTWTLSIVVPHTFLGA